MYAPLQGVQIAGLSGLGCPDCGGTCGGGMSGLNPSTWGLTDWLVAGAGGLLLYHVFRSEKRESQKQRAMRRVRGY